MVYDFLSRVTNEGDDVIVDDAFPDGNLFALSIKTLWFAYIYNYLAT
jgi:hypothetical protein